MCHNIFITQIKRSKKIILYLGLLVLVSSFFVTSVNLYYNSIHNLQVEMCIRDRFMEWESRHFGMVRLERLK